MAFTHWMLVTASPTPSCANQKMSPDIARCPRRIESPKAQNHLSRARYRNLHFFTSPFPGGSEGKASAYSVGDPGSIPGLGRSLKKEMAPHSSTLAWKIPWTEEPGRLHSMGSQRVGYD